MEIGKSLVSLLMFSVDDHRFAVPTAAVRRVLRAAAVTPLPESPAAVHGVLNLQGEFLFVFSSRVCFGLTPRDIVPDECFVVLQTERESFALVADAITGVVDVAPHDFVLTVCRRLNRCRQF
jgi:purine-binding chemotaxis protein CheW